MNDQQRIAEEEKISLQNEKIKCREYEIELLSYMHQNEFMKCALYIISAQKANQKVGMQLIQGKKELPGVSPISLMIQGQNQDLAER